MDKKFRDRRNNGRNFGNRRNGRRDIEMIEGMMKEMLEMKEGTMRGTLELTKIMKNKEM